MHVVCPVAPMSIFAITSTDASTYLASESDTDGREVEMMILCQNLRDPNNRTGMQNVGTRTSRPTSVLRLPGICSSAKASLRRIGLPSV